MSDAAASAKTYNVSVIGLGNMGGALAKAFINNKHNVTVWNRTAAKAEPYAALGAKVAASIPEAISASDVVVVCVLNYDTSDSLFHTDDAIKEFKGKTMIQVTSGSPKAAREGAAWAEQQGILYLDGAIMAEPNEVGKPECTTLYAGPQAIFDANKDLLLNVGGNVMYMGENYGHAAAFDCSILSYFFGMGYAFVHGAAMCQAEGISLDKFHETVCGLTQGVALPIMGQYTKCMKERNYPGDLAKMETFLAGLPHLIKTCKENNLDDSLPVTIETTVKKACEDGRAEQDFSALFEVFLKGGK